MATWDTYDFDKACEDASWYWITLGSPAITPNQNKSNTQSVFNQMVDQSCYNAFRKGGIAFAQNWVDCAAKRYAAKLSQFGKTSDPAFPSAWMYEIHVKARMWIAINRAQKDMAASAAPAPEPTTISKVSLATQARQITALPGQTTARQPAEPSDPFAAIRAAASMPVPITAPAPAPSTGTSFISRIAAMASAVKAPTPIVVAPVPMPGVTPEPSWPEEEGAPTSDEPAVFKPTGLTTTPSVSDLPSSVSGARVAKEWEGTTYYALPEPAAGALLGLFVAAGQKVGFAVIEEGTAGESSYVVAKVVGSSSAPLALIQAANDRGLAVILEQAAGDATKLWVTNDVLTASQVTAQNPESAVVLEPRSGWVKRGDLAVPNIQQAVEVIGEKAKTGLIIGGVVVGVLALGGIAYYFSTRKPAPMRANSRTWKEMTGSERERSVERQKRSRRKSRRK